MHAWRRLGLSIVLAVLLAVGASAVGERATASDGETWLVAVRCTDEAGFRRVLDAGARVPLWWDGQAYALVDAGQRARLAAAGMELALQDQHPSQGDYYVIWAFEAETPGLRQRYGTLVALGDGFYLLGLPPGIQLGPDDGPRYAQHLPASMAAPRPAAQPLLNPPTPPPVLGRIVGSVSEARLVADIAALQDDDAVPGQDALRSRYTRVAGLDAEAAYIARQLSATGLRVSYFPFTYGRTVNDVVAVLPGLRPESEGFYIVCAHYDSTAGVDPRWASNWQTMPAPGADDNGSGTAAVLEAARVLARQRLTYGVRFVLLAGEEQGARGGEAYAAAVQAAGANVLGVINLDMVGYDSNNDGAVEVHTGLTGASEALGQALVRNMGRYAPSLQPSVVTTYAAQASDQAPFWSRGYPALLIIEDRGADFNFRYHTTGDTLRLLNTAYLTHITRAVVGTVGELAQLQAPDLSPSSKAATYEPALAGSLAYTVTLRNGGPLTATAALTDVLPPQLDLWPPIRASQGAAAWDPGGHRVVWSGDIAPQATVVLTYRALLAPSLWGALLIRHAAVVSDGAGQLYDLPAEALVPWRMMLPPIVKGP